MRKLTGKAAVCAAAICGAAFGAASDVDVKDRVLGGNDFSYYRWSGAGETFVMTTAAVTTNLGRRAKFWKRVESATVPTIFQLMFPKTKPDWKQKLPKTAEEAIAAIDAFFAPGEGVEPCPKKIYAVTPCEENVTWEGQTEVQDAIAKHLRDRYGVKTYQWLTEPMKPTLAIQADGWVFDAYCITAPNSFYAHLESFILTGVPVVPCIWASGHFCGYHKQRTWDDLTRFTVERMDMCRALNLPVMVFAVAGKSGSVGLWFGKTDDPGERYYRETIRHYLAAVPTMPKASWKPAPKTWRANVRRDGTVRSKVDLKSFGLVDETTFDDVRSWRFTDAGLNLVSSDGRLAWQMRPQGRVRKGRFSLRHSPNAKGTFCGRPLSTTGLTEIEVDEFDCKTLVLDAAAPITLMELSFFGEGDGCVEVVGVKVTTSASMLDDPSKPWSYFVHPVTCIGMPLQTARTGIQVTPEGTIFTGEHELALFFGDERKPLACRQRRFVDDIPIVEDEWRDGDCRYRWTLFGSTLACDPRNDNTAVFARLRGADFDKELKAVQDYWRKMLFSKSEILTPGEPRVASIHRQAAAHVLLASRCYGGEPQQTDGLPYPMFFLSTQYDYQRLYRDFGWLKMFAAYLDQSTKWQQPEGRKPVHRGR